MTSTGPPAAGSYPEGTILGLRPGDIIDGRIEIVSLIGYGGQGVVLKVNHLEWNRDLALKLPLPDVVGSPVKWERFLREAETWIRLGVHPHIVRCWFVQKISGLPGLFLDFITEGSLENWIKEGHVGPGDWSRVIQTVIQAAEGLAHSHSMGVIHRDVKPENLLIRSDNKICVTDFGLVKSVSDDSVSEALEGRGNTESSDDPGITGAGEFLGTPRYGAPEQWRGSDAVGPAADMYALGNIFYEMLCGRRPFDEDGVPIKLGELIISHLKKPAPDPREFRPDVPPKLAELCLACLEKEPEKRPPSMVALIDALRGCLLEVTSDDYERPQPVPGGDRPDLLNNAGVSLYSLGKAEKARELFQQGLRIESGHPQCLYNLVQLDRRQGRIEPAESLRRLRRANAKYPLALLCIEEGFGKKAIDWLDSIKGSEQNGLVYRTKGDALMYAKQYLLAQRCYDKAQEYMPNDQPTRMRKLLATQGLRGMEGHVLFPSSVSCYSDRVNDPDLQLLISNDSQALIGINATEAVCLNIDTHSLISQAPRPAGSPPISMAWLGSDRLLTQDQAGFELWQLPELKLLQRAEGRIRAVTEDLKRIVLLTNDGLVLLDKIKGEQAYLRFPPGTQPSRSVRACFAGAGRGVCVLTPSGQVGQVDENHHVVPLPWPGQVESFQDVLTMRLSDQGVLFLAHRSGLLQALDFTTKSVLFQHRLPFVPLELEVDVSGKTLVASSTTYSGVFALDGTIVHKGEGPIGVDSTRTHCIAYGQSRLTLYELNPFRRVRSWSQKIPPLKSIRLAKDGRRAVSLCLNGEHHVWEVDEENRVFERSLLLTPGQSYAELVSAYRTYKGSYQRSVLAFNQSDFAGSYKALAQARSVPGFAQAEEALALQWMLLPKLRRGKLQAIWERLSYDGSYLSRLSDDSSYIALATRGEFKMLRNEGSSTSVLRSMKVPRRLLGLHFFDAVGEGLLVICLDQLGQGGFFKVEDGSLITEFTLDQGELRMVSFQEASLFFLTKDNRIGHYDLEQARLTSLSEPIASPIRRLFPLKKDRALAVTEHGPYTMDLKKKKPHSSFTIALSRMPGRVQYAAPAVDGRALLLGFSDGTSMVTESKSGKVLFAGNHKAGGVIAFGMVLGLSLGVAVTVEGKLTLWDLQSGEILEQFTAHPAPIVDLQLSQDGRYMTTTARNGQFRLWETSWHLTEESGPPPVDWLPAGGLTSLSKIFKRI